MLAIPSIPYTVNHHFEAPAAGFEGGGETMHAYQEDGGPRNLMIILGKESYQTSLRFRLRAG